MDKHSQTDYAIGKFENFIMTFFIERNNKLLER